MFIPLRPDGQSTSRPYATLGLIGLQVLIALVIGMMEPTISGLRGGPLFDSLVLRYGVSKPYTWLTSTLVHSNELHLIFNMLFLGTFGIVVESRIGWKRLLQVWLTVALLTGAIESFMVSGQWFAPVGSLGASGVIAALMMMALLWAPGRRVQVFWFFGLHLRSVRYMTVQSHRVGWLVAVYFVFDMLNALMFGWFGGGSAILHLIGAAVGTGVGVLMMRLRWVRTDGEDLWSTIRSDIDDARAYQRRVDEEPDHPFHKTRGATPLRHYAQPVIGCFLVLAGIVMVMRFDGNAIGSSIVRSVLGGALALGGGLIYRHWTLQ